ncbi:uncharacterized protein B0T15DRAFT_24680 [Chaetomium strumarium]|uniref:Secreted protein n=1 Tax=Chaetomium strumarium TaxID=1170767 RepID=A0AAJ0H226_9PEZI|nr:hypothetical protein B0T15DRAFT_24680 [Chaetomium strumarium]
MPASVLHCWLASALLPIVLGGKPHLSNGQSSSIGPILGSALRTPHPECGEDQVMLQPAVHEGAIPSSDKR